MCIYLYFAIPDNRYVVNQCDLLNILWGMDFIIVESYGQLL